MSQDVTTETSDMLQHEADRFKDDYAAAQAEVGKMIVGQQRVVEATLTALFSGGNVLLEGVPGLGKTELVKAMSRVLDLEFRRIQFTPDLMPADIIGTSMMSSDETGQYRFEFRPGPIFTQLLLADEINRASPKTQSALLETMQEASVTTGGTVHHLEQPFFVMATQNPIEQEGTYPLPEAQLDRFMFKVEVPFPNRSEINEVVSRTILKRPVELQKLLDSAQIMELRGVLDKVVVADPMRDYAVRLILSTHPDTEFASEDIKRFIRWGASPRAAQGLIRAARVRALSLGRVHVAFEDIRYFAIEVLQHRVLLNYDGQAENILISELIADSLQQVAEEI
ncbi:ATPase family associated with various cellular activities (AAA) [Symmachiella macrocystis]|uniref:ATPase family associated with various cellular activities (AAA) n=1 Tax=Symmachiella macrocystis TaxID=2527985 RepID=A0A5C6BSW7_9PLAN|nr:MoxR family ATPase [Symmachiella macrocystis]TWU14852.1 ATPase family associated with various cellular activities (AAA) [Symmachiella macrocystis]